MRSVAILALLALMGLAGCLDSGERDGATGDTQPTIGPMDPFEEATWDFAGEFLIGGIDGAQTYTFEVPDGTTEVEAVLTWSIPGASLDFLLTDAAGDENGDGWGESDQHRYVTSTYAVVAGDWTATVTAQQGADVHYALHVTARQAEPFGPISGTYTVGANDFAEINLNMVPGNHFDYEWAADADVYFNVHFHNDGTTERPIEHRGDSLAGNFTGPATEVYSMLWRNEGVLPVTVTFTMDGEYRLHSMTRDPPA